MDTNGNSIAAVGGDISTLTWFVVVIFLIYAIIDTKALDYLKKSPKKK